MSNKFTVRVPASTSNLGSGFDTVSAALSLYLKVEVDVTSDGRIEWSKGRDLPPEENILEEALRRTLNALAARNPGIHLSMDNPIPLRRGLGSSGAAIIAGIKIAEKLSGAQLSQHEIFQIAYRLEGHPDNISASLLGGWVVSWVSDQGMRAEKLPSRLSCRFVLAVPEVTVSTREARAILPESYSRADAVFNLQRCALLVYGIQAGRQDLLREATRDLFHQPYRARLVPGMEQVLEFEGIGSLDEDILSVSISGSGSALIAMARGHHAEIGDWMLKTLQASGTRAVYHILDLDTQGVQVSDNE
ncbi:MAG: homoserine kinase [Acidobacteriota bacterium]